MKLLSYFFLALNLFAQANEPEKYHQFFEVSQGKGIPFYSNYNLTNSHPEPTQAIVVIHGIANNADEYFADTFKTVKEAGHLKDTLVLAPRFQTPENSPKPNELTWGDLPKKSDLWKFGEQSTTLLSDKKGISSFAVLDRLLEQLADKKKFPHLKTITVIGHSAGGQFVSRYAPTTQVVNALAETKVRFVCANPSAYLYFTNERPFANSCADANEYPYGLEKANTYITRQSQDEILRNFSTRDFTLLLGEADTLDEYLDQSCAANAQGKNRFERGKAYHDYLKKLLPSNHFKMVIVPKVGHDHNLMFDSKEGRSVLFIEKGVAPLNAPISKASKANH